MITIKDKGLIEKLCEIFNAKTDEDIALFQNNDGCYVDFGEKLIKVISYYQIIDKDVELVIAMPGGLLHIFNITKKEHQKLQL